MDIRLFTIRDGQVIFGIPEFNQKLEGMDVIIQTIVLELYSTKGSHYANPNSGEGLKGIIKKYNKNNTDIHQLVDSKIRSIEQNMKADQIDKNLPASEMLEYIKLISFEEKKDSLHIVLEVANKENETSQFNLAA